ncbi:hypothetical protein BKA70DRAFT_1240117 [Coprinopsis sp. MPI-PUGE-AT-0042]|nr:hypothetical protein BKA70DRAFT_1240117 [Coprinopsis sp. MPI-PUGE-AT-0042]
MSYFAFPRFAFLTTLLSLLASRDPEIERLIQTWPWTVVCLKNSSSRKSQDVCVRFLERTPDTDVTLDRCVPQDPLKPGELGRFREILRKKALLSEPHFPEIPRRPSTSVSCESASHPSYPSSKPSRVNASLSGAVTLHRRGLDHAKWRPLVYLPELASKLGGELRGSSQRAEVCAPSVHRLYSKPSPWSVFSARFTPGSWLLLLLHLERFWKESVTTVDTNSAFDLHVLQEHLKLQERRHLHRSTWDWDGEAPRAPLTRDPGWPP